MSFKLIEDDEYMEQRQKRLERYALKLAAAWADFDIAELTAAEVVRRFGAIEARDLGALRLHKNHLFNALQTSCVMRYTRAFSDTHGLERFSAKYAVYAKREWQEFHQELFRWAAVFSGSSGVAARQFIVLREEAADPSERFALREASEMLDPSRHFTMLRDMCADRKALLWPDVEAAVCHCYPYLNHPTLLSLGA